MHKYPPIATAVASLPAERGYLDGELCGAFPDGISSFSDPGGVGCRWALLGGAHY